MIAKEVLGVLARMQNRNKWQNTEKRGMKWGRVAEGGREERIEIGGKGKTGGIVTKGRKEGKERKESGKEARKKEKNWKQGDE